MVQPWVLQYKTEGMDGLLDGSFVLLDEPGHARGEQEHQLRIDALVHLRSHHGPDQVHQGGAVFAEVGADGW